VSFPLPYSLLKSSAGLRVFGLATFLLLSAAGSRAQERILTVGLQVKPIFASGLLKTGREQIIQDSVTFDIALRSGLSLGMIVRKGLSDLLSLEAGINYTKRKYDLTITDPGADFRGESNFRIISYEIPTSLLVYIRLGEQTYMNASLGHSLNIFASDILTYDTTYFVQYAVYNTRFRSAILANLGVEFRTEKSGYFYVGATYQRPFGDIYSSHTQYHGNGKKVDVYTGISGSYLTLDLRYFFHEDPQKKTKTKK
jgi:hypothetical protein